MFSQPGGLWADRTDRIGDIVVGQATAGAENGGRDLETTFGRHAGIVPRLTISGGVMLLGLESPFDKSFLGSDLVQRHQLAAIRTAVGAPRRQGRFVPLRPAALMPAAAHRIGRGLPA